MGYARVAQGWTPRAWSIALAALMTAEITEMMKQDLQFYTHSTTTFYNALFPAKFHNEHQTRETAVYHIYTVEEALDVLENAVLSYYSLPRKSVDHFWVNFPARLHLSVWDPAPRLAGPGFQEEAPPEPLRRVTTMYTLSESEPLGPFARNDSVALVRSLAELDLELHWGALCGEGGDFRTFEWEVHLFWDFSHRGGRIDMYLSAAASPTSKKQVGRLVWLNFLLGLLALLSLAYNFWPRAARRLFMLEKWVIRSESNWWRINRSVRDGLVLAFVVLDTCSVHNAPSVFGMPRDWWSQQTSLNSQVAPPTLEDFLIWLEVRHGVHLIRCAAAAGVCWAWICVCETPPHAPASLLWKILAIALPPVVSFLWASIPIYLAFASLGLVLFAEHAPTKFGSLFKACVSLFSVLNGDVIQETMVDLEGAGVVMSRLYVCSFICVFVFVVLNAVLCLIQDSFRQAKVSTEFLSINGSK